MKVKKRGNINVDKERIAELKKQKKMMKKELDDLNGRTVKGKIASLIIFMVVMLVMAGTLVGMVKLNVGGVADNTLAPVIGDVPIARSILPKRLQKKNASELAAEKKRQKMQRQQKMRRKKQKKKQQHKQRLQQRRRRRHRHRLRQRQKNRQKRLQKHRKILK